MKIDSLNNMLNGWVIGDFDPSVFKTNAFEFAIKKYKKNDYEQWSEPQNLDKIKY